MEALSVAKEINFDLSFRLHIYSPKMGDGINFLFIAEHYGSDLKKERAVANLQGGNKRLYSL